MRTLTWCALAALVLGCDPPAAPEEPEVVKTEFTCELGVPGPGGAFVPAGPEAETELMLGFQGFLVVIVRVRAAAEDMPAESKALFSLEAGDAPKAGSAQPKLRSSPGPDGTAVTDDVLIFLPGGELSLYEGRLATVAVRIDGPVSTCVATGVVSLVDHDECVHTGTEPLCPEAGGEAAAP